MITEVMKKTIKNNRRRSEAESRCTSGSVCLHPKSINLYRFIRLILGPDIKDADITRQWGMDSKNFSEFKNGKTPVPRLERLEQLARVLKVNKHLVFQVAGGASADKVFNLIRKNDLPGQMKLLFGKSRKGM